MQRVLVGLEGDHREVAEIVFESYDMRPPLNYAVFPREGRDRAPHWFDTLVICIFNRVITWHEFEVELRSRSQLVFGAFREVREANNEGSLVGATNFNVDTIVMYGIAAEHLGLSYPQLLLLRYYLGVADGWRKVMGHASETERAR